MSAATVAYLARRQADGHAGRPVRVAVALDRHGLGALEELHPARAHAVDDVPAQIARRRAAATRCA